MSTDHDHSSKKEKRLGATLNKVAEHEEKEEIQEEAAVERAAHANLVPSHRRDEGAPG